MKSTETNGYRQNRIKIITLPDKTWNYGEETVKEEALGLFVYH